MQNPGERGVTTIAGSRLHLVESITFMAGHHILYKMRDDGYNSYFVLFDRSGAVKEINHELQRVLTSEMNVVDSKMVSKNHSFMILEDEEKKRTVTIEVRYYESQQLLCFNQLCDKDREAEEKEFIDRVCQVFNEGDKLKSDDEARSLIRLGTQLNNRANYFMSVSLNVLVMPELTPTNKGSGQG